MNTITQIKERTRAMQIGATYFLSSFADKDGANVKVLSATTDTNGAGWPSSVTVRVLEPVNQRAGYHFYDPGTIHTVNATNLYETQHLAAHSHKYQNVDVFKLGPCPCGEGYEA